MHFFKGQNVRKLFLPIFNGHIHIQPITFHKDEILYQMIFKNYNMKLYFCLHLMKLFKL